VSSQRRSHTSHHCCIHFTLFSLVTISVFCFRRVHPSSGKCAWAPSSLLFVYRASWLSDQRKTNGEQFSLHSLVGTTRRRADARSHARSDGLEHDGFSGKVAKGLSAITVSAKYIFGDRTWDQRLLLARPRTPCLPPCSAELHTLRNGSSKRHTDPGWVGDACYAPPTLEITTPCTLFFPSPLRP
jgi:hypothetical protein